MRDATARKHAAEALKQAHDVLESRVAERTVALQQVNQQLQAEIAERTPIEAALRSSQQQLRHLATHLQNRQEEERRHIAREIHDELGQALTTLKIDVSWLSRRAATASQPWQECLSRISSQLETVINVVRRISTALRPGVLDDLGLTAALEWQLQDVRKRTGLAYQLTLPLEEVDVEPARTTAVFRIFQEALTNVLRHAEATSVAVQVTQDDDALLLEVADNGKGISPNQVADHTALGLLGMRERAHLWGGDVTIEGTPGVGTTVRVRMPRESSIGSVHPGASACG
jgi:signal transduction histidine kinase